MLKKWWHYPVLFGLVCVLAGAALLGFVVSGGRRLNAPEPADALIVLGAQVYPSGELSLRLKGRLDLALSLYGQGYADTIIVCGAQGPDEPMPEADAMRDYLIANGMPGEAILCDRNSYNTTQNITNARAIMEAEGLETAVIVTSDYHLRRALAVAGDLGVPATGAGSKRAETMAVHARSVVREMMSWVKYALS